MMGSMSLNLITTPTILPFGSRSFAQFAKKKARASCSLRDDDAPLSIASSYAVLGLDPHCSAADIKAAFRTKVLLLLLFHSFQFHN